MTLEKLKKLKKYMETYKIQNIGDDIQIINKRGKILKPVFNKGRYTIYLSSPKLGKTNYQIKDIKNYLKGIIILDDEKTKHKMCIKCELDYPLPEMRGNICYLCKQENRGY